jgi:hypothetical protein
MKIPSNLKPGDRLWYSKTEYATVRRTKSCPSCYDNNSIRAMAYDCIMVYMLEDGREWFQDTPPIIRIERIASKPAKPKRDADAAWLRAICTKECTLYPHMYDRDRRMIRRIAKRLEGGKP